MPEAVKCPACADENQQERLGQVSVDNPGQLPPELYRCGVCAFLYAMPKLEDHESTGGPD